MPRRDRQGGQCRPGGDGDLHGHVRGGFKQPLLTAIATYAGNATYLGSSATASITIKLPVATAGDQCKQGGWQTLTDDLGNRFKNQGDCVSYVATAGKNKGAIAP